MRLADLRGEGPTRVLTLSSLLLWGKGRLSGLDRLPWPCWSTCTLPPLTGRDLLVFPQEPFGPCTGVCVHV